MGEDWENLCQSELFVDFNSVKQEKTHKTCVYCGISKGLSCFNKHIGHKDNLDTRCRDCMKKQSRIRRDLYKTAPQKPEFCECCGEKPKKWTLDHDHNDNSFRGWVCDHCNLAIGLLGDDISGVERALKYLKTPRSSDI